ncbi:hypothetical protein AB0M28_22040 [Streptomyces sp. NPDC051940]|uniref:hypothetical protein n=1 Tax=Streptomyces sp. NPDC051940 TaxID=3155675 RepID=UPI00341B6F74
MTNTVLLDDTTTDTADLDLDVQVAGISPDAAFGGSMEKQRLSGVSCGSTSPSTYGVQSRCPYCCC